MESHLILKTILENLCKLASRQSSRHLIQLVHLTTNNCWIPLRWRRAIPQLAEEFNQAEQKCHLQWLRLNRLTNKTIARRETSLEVVFHFFPSINTAEYVVFFIMVCYFSVYYIMLSVQYDSEVHYTRCLNEINYQYKYINKYKNVI